MTKTLKRNIILSLAALILAAIAGVLCFAPRQHYAKADADVDYSTYSEVTTGSVKANNFIVIFDDSLQLDYSARTCQYTGDGEDPNITFFFMASTIVIFSKDYNTYEGYLVGILYADLPLFYDGEVPVSAVGSVFTAESITISETTVNAEDLLIPVENYAASGIRFFAPIEAEEPGEPTEPTDPTPGEPEDPTEPENPGETTDPVTEEPAQNNSDVGEWFNNLGNDVATWLQDNTGIATTGSVVLIVGAVIIGYLLFFRKRR